MPVFTPGRRWQQAYYPFHKETLTDRFLETLERTTKGILFGCRMCGNCLLQETAFICSMECPKGLRNGPCGGSTPEHCYVDETRPCIWFKIYERSEKMGRTHKLLEVLPPLDWSKVGTDIWKDVYYHWRQKGGLKATWRILRATPEERAEAVNQFFYEIRQPEWWQGDDKPHPAPAHEPVSHLEELFSAGKFVVTAEIAPPLAAVPDDVIKKVNMMKDFVDAVNFTDNPSATARMSSLACSVIALQQGVEPVMQITTRDRTRLGLQAEALGASALGVHNILCLTGDHSSQGPAPQGRMDIWDLDSIQMIWLLRRMRDEGHFMDERQIKTPPVFFIGAAGSPYASRDRFQALREEKKVNAGAQFMQTNLVYDVDGFERYLAELDKRNLLGRVHLMVGITPVRSVKAAQAMDRVPGVVIPQTIMDRLERAADPKEEGVQITLETVERVRRLPGISGIHFMALGWESIVPRLIKESGLR